MSKLEINNMMRIFMTLLTTLSMLPVGFAQSKALPTISGPAPIIKWDVDTTDLGDIDAGDIVEFDLGFTNVGQADLIIEVVTACKCIDIDYPRSPIPPGARGNIVIVFDSMGIKDGKHHKTIDVISNTNPILVETFMKTNILPKKPK
jgi:hypothetical protein